MTSTHQFLEVINRLGREKIPVRKVYRRLRDRELFLSAYGKLYANKGAMTPGIETNKSVDGMSLDRIDAIIEQLAAGTYQWTPVKRKNIPKKDGRKRPIGIPAWEDKLLQEVIRMVLEAYYEPQFSSNSHGFRPNHGCHTALRNIETTLNGTVWFIEGDIKGCFENLQHNVILEILGRSFQDNRFLKLIRGLLKAGYMEDWKYHKTYTGTPQGGIVSPILANIVLNELDQWVDSLLIPQYTQGKKRRRNPKYTKACRQVSKARQEGNVEAVKQAQKDQLSLRSGDPTDATYRRLRFCRYADDFIFGFIGSKSEAIEIKAKVQQFLEGLGLEQHEEKTLITHATKEKARFLGYEIRVAYSDSKQKTIKRNGHVTKIRSINGGIQLLVPKEVIQGYVSKYSAKGKPKVRAERLHLSDFELISQYGAELRGLVNYYKLALNIHTVSIVEWTMTESAVRTLANKHKCSRRSIYRKYRKRAESGKKAMIVELPNPNNPEKPYRSVLGETPLRTDKYARLRETIYVPQTTRTQLVERLLAQKCELCGSTENIEVHHIRALRDLRQRWCGRKDKPLWAKHMIEHKRKTLVVCRICHRKIDAGRYDGQAIRKD